MPRAPMLEKIRNKPHAEKIRLIWIIAGVVALVLLIVWIVVGQAPKPTADTGIFGTIRHGWQDVKNNYQKAFDANSNNTVINNTANNSY